MTYETQLGGQSTRVPTIFNEILLLVYSVYRNSEKEVGDVVCVTASD